MPLKDDLFQRTIDKLAELSKALLVAANQNDLYAAEEAIENAYAQHLASKGEVLRQLSTQQLLDILSSAGHVDKEKAFLLATIFSAEVELEKAKSQQTNTSKQLKALDLYLEAAIDDVDAENVHQQITNLEMALEDFVLPEETYWRFFDYAQYTGQFAKAEDRLFSMLDTYGSSPFAKEKGEAFYTRILELKDAELEKGNLPRDEVLDGQEEFQRQFE